MEGGSVTRLLPQVKNQMAPLHFQRMRMPTLPVNLSKNVSLIILILTGKRSIQDGDNQGITCTEIVKKEHPVALMPLCKTKNAKLFIKLTFEI